MIRPCRVGKCDAPIPWPCDRKSNDSERLYEFYLQEDDLLRISFLEYARIYKVEGGELKSYSSRGKGTIAIGVRYASEMKDHFIGQLSVMHMPHYSREQLQLSGDVDCDFLYVRCILGLLHYLVELTYNDDGTIRLGTSGHYASAKSF
mgnify:CR=1 FL=1